MSALYRDRVQIAGVVQGVGFRPFIYRLANSEGLAGWVRNLGSRVEVDLEGHEESLERFYVRLAREKPSAAIIESVESLKHEPVLPHEASSGFRILESCSDQNQAFHLAPDLAICRECLAEILNPLNRRYRYPFTTCTDCGPRYSIVDRLPFDRMNTSMREFEMCALCREEYKEPNDRRFHSQTNACERCGPVLELRDSGGCVCAIAYDAVTQAAAALKAGKLVAVKGIGGFQLLVDATQDAAVMRLREKKQRQSEPLALLMADLGEVSQYCFLSSVESDLLQSPQAPIVLLQRYPERTRGTENDAPRLSESVAPGVSLYGVMLASSPLYVLLMKEVSRPLVVTSGNLKGEPMSFQECDAFERLKTVADYFMTHNRGILRGLDDSMVREIAGRPTVFRRARGYVPVALEVPGPHWIANPDLVQDQNAVFGDPVLAWGGHLKNTIALGKAGRAYVSPHLGTLESTQGIARYEQEIQRLLIDCDAQPSRGVCDTHPDYYSTKTAETAFAESGLRVVRVQHHCAHILSCLVDNGIQPPVLGVAWDGGGFGPDETVWGGEFIQIDGTFKYDRVAHVRRFRLPGGETAVLEPRRALLGVLYELFGDLLFSNLLGSAPDLEKTSLNSVPSWIDLWSASECQAFKLMLARPLNAPLCSSVGRLFDAVAALIGLRKKNDYEGQAALELESLAWQVSGDHSAKSDQESSYSISILKTGSGYQLDWGPMLKEMLADLGREELAGRIALKFHWALAKGIKAVAMQIGIQRVVLSGGVFQNKILTEATIRELRASGFEPFWHSRIPPNDGGISLGQLMAGMTGIAPVLEPVLEMER